MKKVKISKQDFEDLVTELVDKTMESFDPQIAVQISDAETVDNFDQLERNIGIFLKNYYDVEA
jgi:hypothetical protein